MKIKFVITKKMFKIKLSDDNQFYVTLQGGNNEVLYTSEMFTTKDSAYNNIYAVFKTITNMTLQGNILHSNMKNHIMDTTK